MENNMNKFLELVRDQFSYGGKKYALSGSASRESTDELFDKHGKNWLFGTIDKYTFRFRNLARERDLLKIATYMYILWLKRGFFVTPRGINDPPIDTNLKIKEEQFNLFIKNFKELLGESVYIEELFAKRTEDEAIRISLDGISYTLAEFSKNEWKQISQYDLFSIFKKTYMIWNVKFSTVAGADTDTHNEDKK
jgi:hypothetical protein